MVTGEVCQDEEREHVTCSPHVQRKTWNRDQRNYSLPDKEMKPPTVSCTNQGKQSWIEIWH